MEKPKTTAAARCYALTVASALGRAALTYALGPAKTPRPVPAAAYGNAPSAALPNDRAWGRDARREIVGLARRISAAHFCAGNGYADPNDRAYASMDLTYAVEEMTEILDTLEETLGA